MQPNPPRGPDRQTPMSGRAFQASREKFAKRREILLGCSALPQNWTVELGH